MVGLLDLLTKDPEQQRALTQGLLSGAFGAMAGRGSRLQAWGQGGLAGLAGYGQSLDRSAQERERAQQMERQKIQDQLLQGQLGQMKREQQIAELPNQFMVPGMKPDTMDNRDVGMPGEQQIPAQSFDQPGYLNALKGLDFNRWLSTSAALHQPEPAPIKASPGDVFFNRSGQKLFEAPSAAEKDPEQIRQLKSIYGDGTPAYQAALQRLGGKMTTHAPAASVNVNTGQKGFDNTLKLRGDFRSEPVYKAHQEMQAAYSQIKQSLKQASPAGDLAGATKIMKLLDPGSVVRESELGMAMAANGLLDRVQNYAGMVISGTKLTPTQRKDFQTLADALYSESVNQYNAKRGEYKGIVERNQLNEADVIGAETPGPAQANDVDALVNKYRSKK